MIRFIPSTLVVLLLAVSARAVPTLDGVKDAGYGAAWAVQTVETGFGDNLNELNAAYAQIEGGTLYLMLTGQVQNNFNRLNLFFDSVPGGQNQVQPDGNFGGTNPENDGWANKYNGMTFDAGFAADYLIILRNGNNGGDRFDIDFAVVGGGLGAFQTAGNVFGGSLTGSNASALPNGIGVAYNNSNMAGIAGGTDAADQAAALAATTGLELAIPLSVLGNPNPEDILVSAMINGSNHDYLSNQFLGGLAPPQVNVGGDGAGSFTGSLAGVNLNNLAGDQFFRVAVPEPASITLLALAGAIAATWRRRTAAV
ncbi:MAG TPA: hypothetical protein DD670_15115 [Planctomycetaceae bacterium]|nr:hypothetical protein [Planctomycetaceae bacterium]